MCGLNNEEGEKPGEVWEGTCYLLTGDQDGVCLLRLWEVWANNVDESHVSSVGASEGILLLWDEMVVDKLEEAVLGYTIFL